MKYSYKFKIKCVEAYKTGRQIEVPKGIKSGDFKRNVRIWVRLYDLHGADVLKRKAQNTEWTAEKRMEIVAEVLAGNSIKSTAIKYGINQGQLYQWVKKYNIEGYNGLVEKPRGRNSKEKSMKRNDKNPEPLTPSEREELILLRERTKSMEAEIAAIKKERALRLKRWDEALKAKKQKSSKNSKNKDTN